MSHAHGEVILDGKVIGHYEYNGTSDVALPNVYDTPEEVTANWRKGGRECSCGQPSIDVTLFSYYGSGFHWPGKYCPRCRLITGNRMPFEGYDVIPPYDSTDGHPLHPCACGRFKRNDWAKDDLTWLCPKCVRPC